MKIISYGSWSLASKAASAMLHYRHPVSDLIRVPIALVAFPRLIEQLAGIDHGLEHF
jgi:hypothetical protein